MKKLLSLTIIAMLSLGMIAFIAPNARAATPIMYADPATHTANYPVWPGAMRWNFSIMVNDTANVLTIACSVKSLDNTKAKVVNYYKGVDFTTLGFSIYTIGLWDSANGDVQDLTAASMSPISITSPAEIFKIEVEGEAFTAGTVIDIYAQYVGDVDNNALLSGDCPNDHTVYLNQVIPPPYSPTAAFTFLPAMPFAGSPINFDATASTGGFDGANMCPITQYSWDWNNDAIFDDVTALPTIIHTFAIAGLYPVTLEVLAPPGIGANITYVPTDDVTNPVTVYPVATDRAIDLYTQDWRYPGYFTTFTGLAPAPSGSQVDSYSPQDLVCLYAKLTYNGEPIAYKEVAFEVHGPANPYQNITLWRQTFTNGSGIAEFCFRIPWPDVHAEDIVFGEWIAMAKASVANEEIFDMHWWLVHWMVDIVDETVVPNPVEELGTVTVSVTVKNWALTPRNFTYTATLYDELGVPVGAAYLDVVDAPPGISGPYSVQIFVPEWAYVGIGTVYKNLFTKLPWLCGVCWSPEYSEAVVISATDPHIPPF